jgi:hypothetical protein
VGLRGLDSTGQPKREVVCNCERGSVSSVATKLRNWDQMFKKDNAQWS